MRGSNYKALTGKILIMDLLMGGGCLLEVVIHGSSTVLQCHVRSKYNILNFINKPCIKFHFGGKLNSKPAVLTKIEVASRFD